MQTPSTAEGPSSPVTVGTSDPDPGYSLFADKFVAQEFSYDQVIETYELCGHAAEHDALKVQIHGESSGGGRVARSIGMTFLVVA